MSWERDHVPIKKTFWQNYIPPIYENIENLLFGLTVRVANVQFYKIHRGWEVLGGKTIILVLSK
jgi:hypothetical protein